MKLNWKEIEKKIEGLQNGLYLKFKIPPTFGGDFAIIELNPNYPGKEEKKYFLKVGKDEDLTKNGQPYWASDKSKEVAKWVAERFGDFIG
jgi:hypothetical protein